MIRKKDLYTALSDSAYRYPERVAFVFEGKKYTFHELQILVDKCADMFWTYGIRKGDSVAIAHKNSIWFVITSFALYKLSAIAVPINFMISKPEEIKFIIEDSGATMVILQNEFLRAYKKTAEIAPSLKYFFCSDYPENNEDERVKDLQKEIENSKIQSEILEHKPSLEDNAFILYTSGTTGAPKGAVVTHGNLAANIISCAQVFRIAGDDAMICLLPMFHTFAWMTCVILPIYLGLKSVIAPSITPPSAWLHLMGVERVTLFIAIPQIFYILAKEARGIKRLYLQYWAFRKVRFCISGAAPLNKESQDHFEKNLGIQLLEGYGLTETSPVISVNLEEKNKKGSVGPALPSVKVVILDDNENELPRNAEGEISVKGPNVFKQYHNNPEGTKEAFSKEGWFKTGDIGLVDDEGFIFIKDRKKDMIIIKGLKVFSAQVEATIMQFPGIEECAIIGVPDGRGGEFIKLYAVKAPGVDFNETAFRKFLKTNLDNYKRPRDIEFMTELPKNSLRKILKRELRKDAVEKLKERTVAPAEE
ncbi:Putative fatty acid Co-A ligase [Elusimicrobium minutum Pei191]|uniref:Putative fatty acid Co-A ligase n=1 Tax=Elusimicrobium minutum (strain Pei191) TaxID=445932 RepID=B2KE41_ELUMP|nr:AMP-binding protein [Elusimicrobium minutum]ACC98787.1 Putative fatty acid Co-A ligase [Elusimicrobium minutum Pei191]